MKNCPTFGYNNPKFKDKLFQPLNLSCQATANPITLLKNFCSLKKKKNNGKINTEMIERVISYQKDMTV